MKKASLILVISPALFNIAGAAAIANWKEFNTNAAVVPITDANTDSPVFGDGTADSAQAAWIAGQFGTTGLPASVTLAVGDTLTVSGRLTLTGGTNNANQFRFGVFNDGGQFAADDGSNWTGGWLHSIGTNAASDLYQARTNGAFISTGANALDLNSVVTRTGAFDGDSVAPFSFSMTVTRDSATTVDVVSLITGGDGSYSEEYVEDDITTGNFTYSAAGLLFGGSAGVEQASFASVQYEVTAIPEPSSLALAGLGVMGLFGRRKRS